MVANAGTDGGETAEPNGLRGSQEQAGGWLLQQPLFVYLLRAAWPLLLHTSRWCPRPHAGRKTCPAFRRVLFNVAFYPGLPLLQLGARLWPCSCHNGAQRGQSGAHVFALIGSI